MALEKCVVFYLSFFYFYFFVVQKWKGLSVCLYLNTCMWNQMRDYMSLFSVPHSRFKGIKIVALRETKREEFFPIHSLVNTLPLYTTFTIRNAERNGQSNNELWLNYKSMIRLMHVKYWACKCPRCVWWSTHMGAHQIPTFFLKDHNHR